MSYKTCHHIMENGNFCNSPAISKRDYCYFHIEFRARRLKMARARARRQQWWLDLPAIEDMRSCQAATVRVNEAIAAQLIEPAYAKLLLSSLRLLASNFKARKAWTSLSDYRVNNAFSFVGKYPGFEAVHDLPEDLDLDQDPLKLFPMPQVDPVSAPLANSEERTANGESSVGAPCKPSFGLSGNSAIRDALRDAKTAIPGLPGMEVTADDIELWETVEREGEKAALQRAAELERNRRRRERRLQRARYEEMARNRNIQVAAQKLLLDQQRTQAAAIQADPATQALSAEYRDLSMKKPPASYAKGVMEPESAAKDTA